MTERGSRGDFFAVDARAWYEVCGVGLNAAVSYLVMARGSGGDQATTSWSVNAIEKYTGISRPLAKAAIEALLTNGLVDVVKRGKRPQYRLRPGVEFEIMPAPDDGADPPATPWIWLPNALIDGVPGNAAAPVELVRQTQQIEALQLLIDLYKVHDLQAFGGVYWRIIREEFERERLGESNENTVWAFKRRGRITMFRDHEFFYRPDLEEGVKAFWDAFYILKNLGLFEFVPHLIEADNDQAALIHPFGWHEGEPAERRLAIATHKLARAAKGSAEFNGGMLVSAPRHMGEIAMVGLLRLRYRPHTRATAAWMSRMPEWEALAAAREATGRSRAA